MQWKCNKYCGCRHTVTTGLGKSPKATEKPSSLAQPPLESTVIKHEPAAVQARIPAIYSAESSKTLSGSEYSIRLEGSYLLNY